MTLIGAVKTDTELLLGADRALIYGSPSTGRFNVPAPKLFKSSSQPSVEWGFAGNQPPGLWFGAWLDKQIFTSWDQAATGMGRTLAAANGEGRARAVKAGAGTFEGVEVLVIGDELGEGRVLYVDDEGGTAFLEDQPMFIGGGAPFAMAAYNTAVRTGAATADAFRAATEVATEVVPLLGQPAELRSIPI